MDSPGYYTIHFLQGTYQGSFQGTKKASSSEGTGPQCPNIDAQGLFKPSPATRNFNADSTHRHVGSPGVPLTPFRFRGAKA